MGVKKFFRKAFNIGDLLESQVEGVTTAAMEQALENLQELKGREIKLSVTIKVDDILGE